MRVLHVVSQMNRAGIETWLMHVLRKADRDRFQMDFLVHGDSPGDYDDEIRACGSRLFAGPHFRQRFSYRRQIRELLRSESVYDVVHAHVDYLSGYSLKIAAEIGVPVRIAHCHNDLTRSFSKLRWSLQLLSLRGKSLVSKYSTHRLAASAVAGESLFGGRFRTAEWRVLPCGLDLAPYAAPLQRAAVRREFGVPDDSVVIGHVGRMATQKNHRKILQMMSVIAGRTTKCHLVLVGEGPLRRDVEQEALDRGLGRFVTFAGVRGDVPRLMRSLFDVFVFPSHFEGLGLVLIEAQAAGCPAVVSDVVPPEADVVPELISRLPLASEPEIWADKVLCAAHSDRSEFQSKNAFDAMSRSPFNISQSVKSLTRFYEQAISR